MGNTKSGALSKEILDDLKLNTRYTEEELCAWYATFLKECPTGRITKEQFEGIYASFFPDADPTAYARHVFRSFDTNADGTLDFKEYIVALHLTSSGKTMRKLEWAFALYDVDGNGTISKNEVQEIVRTRKTFRKVRTRQKSERTKSGTFSERRKMIRLERGNSFRASWKTKTS
ncbi:recoverin-like isoform X2 [Cyprinus carpio]|uniref:Recoverin-like isoform X2 n=1 Tax=Cyprinus carpio TaxID=7962 RepID=A0A9Q9W5M7_CYPCA|nr:recoverin-like isoform X2 [Cyprinus carpio]